MVTLPEVLAGLACSVEFRLKMQHQLLPDASLPACHKVLEVPVLTIM